jgi:hypothetical protein
VAADIKEFKVWASGFGTSLYAIEWLRFGPDSPVPELVQSVPPMALSPNQRSSRAEGNPGKTVASLRPPTFFRFDHRRIALEE